MEKTNELGQLNYINPNCWVAKTMKAPPQERCRYCTVDNYKNCPNLKYLITTIVLIFISLGGVFLIERKFSSSLLRVVLFSDFILAIAYGFLFNKVTTENIEKDYKVKQELKIEVEEKTKKLRLLTENLDKKIHEKTEELQKKVVELEKFKSLMINRELEMIKLKKEIRRIKEQ